MCRCTAAGRTISPLCSILTRTLLALPCSKSWVVRGEWRYREGGSEEGGEELSRKERRIVEGLQQVMGGGRGVGRNCIGKRGELLRDSSKSQVAGGEWSEGSGEELSRNERIVEG